MILPSKIRRWSVACLMLALAMVHNVAAGETAAESIVQSSVDPPEVNLTGPAASFSLLVSGQAKDGRTLDLTRDAKYVSSNAAVAAVSDAGVVQSRGDGTAEIRIDVGGLQRVVKVSVSNAKVARRLNF